MQRTDDILLLILHSDPLLLIRSAEMKIKIVLFSSSLFLSQSQSCFNKKGRSILVFRR